MKNYKFHLAYAETQLQTALNLIHYLKYCYAEYPDDPTILKVIEQECNRINKIDEEDKL